MKNISKIRSFLILLSIILGVIYAIPNFINISNERISYSFLPGKKINLGLDLKGGSYLLLKADMDVVFDEKLLSLMSDIRYSLRKNKVGYKKLVTNNNTISFEKRGNVSDQQISSIILALDKNLILESKKIKFI